MNEKERIFIKLSISIFLITIAYGCGTIMTPLTKAASSGDTATIRSLIKQGSSVNERSEGRYYASALHWAARYGHIDAVKLLLDSGASINELDYCEQTPLIYAIYGNTERAADIAVMLIDRGANVDLVDCFGWRAIDYARRNQDRRMMELISKKETKGAKGEWVESSMPYDYTIDYKTSIPTINYKSNKKIAIIISDQRQYVISTKEKPPEYVGYTRQGAFGPTDFTTTDKIALAEILGKCIGDGFTAANYNVISERDKQFKDVMNAVKSNNSDRIIHLVIKEWIIETEYWTEKVSFRYDIILSILDKDGKNIKSIDFADTYYSSGGYRGVQHMRTKTVAPEFTQQILTDIFNKPGLAETLR